jgi:hypothetical protein
LIMQRAILGGIVDGWKTGRFRGRLGAIIPDGFEYDDNPRRKRSSKRMHVNVISGPRSFTFNLGTSALTVDPTSFSSCVRRIGLLTPPSLTERTAKLVAWRVKFSNGKLPTSRWISFSLAAHLPSSIPHESYMRLLSDTDLKPDGDDSNVSSR